MTRPLSFETLHLEGPQQGEALVEVVRAGACHSDLSVIDGSRPRPLPMVLGHEAAGIVREVGAGVDDVRVGDAVSFLFVPSCGACRPCLRGRPALCEEGARSNAAGTLPGGGVRFRDASGSPVHHMLGVSTFSRFVVVSQRSLVRLPEDVTPEEAAPFGCAVLTGMGAAVHAAAVREDDDVVVVGLGGVGLSAVMGAAWAGARRVVAVDVRDDKLALARAVGATHVVRAGSPSTDREVADLLDGGADAAIECVGRTDVLEQAFEWTRRGGTTVTVGLPDPSQRASFAGVRLTAEERTVRGSYMGSGVPRRDLARWLQAYRDGVLPVGRLVTGTVHVTQANEAFDALARGEAVRTLFHFEDPSWSPADGLASQRAV